MFTEEHLNKETPPNSSDGQKLTKKLVTNSLTIYV